MRQLFKNCLVKNQFLFSIKGYIFVHTPLAAFTNSGIFGNVKLQNTTQPSETMFTRRKTRQPLTALENADCGLCTTYATADYYRLVKLVDYVLQDTRLRQIVLPLDVMNAAMFLTKSDKLTRINGNGYILFFREGAISFWNISEAMIKEIIHIVRKFEVEPYKVNLVHWEKERMEYTFVLDKTRFLNNAFQLNVTNSPERLYCDIYAFSNALVASVKLAHWEHSLDILISSIESLPRSMMKGSFLRNQSPKIVLKKLGEVLMIRHRLNLQYNMLEVPDVYWDEEDLERLYIETTEFLNIQRRVKIMNEKLSYCAHIVGLVKSHLAETKSIRIEILIVLLILIEVLFEVAHYAKTYFVESKPTRD